MIKKIFKVASVAVIVANVAVISNITLANGKNSREIHRDPCAINSQLPNWQPLATSQASPHADVNIYTVELVKPADPRFRDAMGGMPTNFSLESFHAAEGRMVLTEHPEENGELRTDITFHFSHLFPQGVYSLWDVTTPLDFDENGNRIFADRPLMNEEDKVWLKEERASMDAIENNLYGGLKGMGTNTFRADQCGNAHVTMKLDHRPGSEFLLDYHANDYAKGGIKGQDVFPGVLWGVFPEMSQ